MWLPFFNVFSFLMWHMKYASVLNTLWSLEFCLVWWNQFRNDEIRNMSEFQVCSVKAGYWGTREFLSGIPWNTTTEHCGILQNTTTDYFGIQRNILKYNYGTLAKHCETPQNTTEYCGILQNFYGIQLRNTFEYNYRKLRNTLEYNYRTLLNISE